MNRGTTVAGAVLGAALMYLFDPDRGRQRRALLRDKAASGLNSVRAAAAVTQRDLWNRASGLIAELWAQLTSGPVPDDVLLRRIRSHLGRVVSHPGLSRSRFTTAVPSCPARCWPTNTCPCTAASARCAALPAWKIGWKCTRRRKTSRCCEGACHGAG